MGLQIAVDRRAEAVPAGQHQPALRPAEHPGNGAQVFDALGRLARGRAAADVEGGDFGNDGGLPEISGETGSVVNQIAVGVESAFGKFIHDAVELPGRFDAVFVVGQAGFDGGGKQHFEIAPAGIRVAVLG